jgi:hypothetical protein
MPIWWRPDEQLMSRQYNKTDFYPWDKKNYLCWDHSLYLDRSLGNTTILTPQFNDLFKNKFQVDIVMRYDESRLDDFTGLLLVDSASNRFLNLTLINGRGTIHGMVTGYNSSQAIQVFSKMNLMNQRSSNTIMNSHISISLFQKRLFKIIYIKIAH